MGKKLSKKSSMIVAFSILFVLFLIVLVLSIPKLLRLPRDFSGYFYKIEDLRTYIDEQNEKSLGNKTAYYNGCDYIFTEKNSDFYIDFTINLSENRIVVIWIDVKEYGNSQKFKHKTSTAMYLDEVIKSSVDNYYWFYQWPTVSKYSAEKLVKWCVVSEASGLYDEKYGSFAFEYNGENYYILYEITNTDINE